MFGNEGGFPWGRKNEMSGKCFGSNCSRQIQFFGSEEIIALRNKLRKERRKCCVCVDVIAFVHVLRDGAEENEIRNREKSGAAERMHRRDVGKFFHFRIGRRADVDKNDDRIALCGDE